jgi:hypothetical protein
MNMGRGDQPDGRRIALGIVAAILLVTSALMTFWPGQSGTASFAASASGRIGLVLAALWLAWPSLQRPASWLPPGIVVLCVLALAVIAAQPRLVVVAVPAVAALIALAGFVRMMRGSSR